MPLMARYVSVKPEKKIISHVPLCRNRDKVSRYQNRKKCYILSRPRETFVKLASLTIFIGLCFTRCGLLAYYQHVEGRFTHV